MIMNIAWLTVRKWDDFCSTTTDALAHGLIERGHLLTVFNGDASEHHASKPWSHISLEQSSFPGRSGASLARSAVLWFQENPEESYDAIVVDWPLAPRTAGFLEKQGHRLVLMDRSPPADVSLLGKLQWRVWKKAWGLVKKGVIDQGTVVSDAHRTFVHNRRTIDYGLIHVIPAGVHLAQFSSQNKRYDGTLKMVYHGRLDKHRGVLALPMLARKLLNHGVKVDLTLVGEGDAYEVLKEISTSESSITVSPSMAREEISALLEVQHIGLLPMPDTPVWSLASPLKRSEYLASGLLVYGTDHAGHQLEQTSTDWFQLASMENFHNQALNWFNGMDENKLRIGSKAARLYAEAHCSWEKSVDRFERVLYNGE
tara:strand:+ start:12154 stop:13263 length:1110 start_codon:yes stop_codon:yes gene_type:complete